MFITISISAQLLENGWDIDSWKGVLCGGVVGLPKLIQQVGLLLCHSQVYHHGGLPTNQFIRLRNGWNVGSDQQSHLDGA